MKLNKNALEDRTPWEQNGFTLPRYDIDAVREKTATAPVWLHFGAGNIFRAFLAAALQDLLDKGVCDKGVIVAEGFDLSIIEKAYRPFDNLSVVVTLKADGSIDKTVVGSVTESLVADKNGDWDRLAEIFTSPSLQMVSFTITEKGYEFLGEGGTMETVVKLLRLRYENGAQPLALVSMDNCSHNGERLQTAVTKIAARMIDAGAAEPGFLSYLNDPARVSFPWSMIDKITPRPDSGVQDMLRSASFEDAELIVTEKNTYTAAFVNAEEAQYLIVEDAFPNGRPLLEGNGVLFTDRETVNRVEAMKVCTCLNPLHTVLAVFGCLLGYTSIHKEMLDDDLRGMIERLGYREGMPVVVNPGILDPKKFLDEVLQTRLPNPFVPDTPQRIATDTSQKLAIRFGETIKAYLKNPALSVGDLKIIPLMFAGWCRYLMAVDDEGAPFTLSPDPLLDDVRGFVDGITLGGECDVHAKLLPLLKNAAIFGVDLYEAGLAEQVESYFTNLISGKGAVRNTIRTVLSED